jgi:hypothetical protein
MAIILAWLAKQKEGARRARIAFVFRAAVKPMPGGCGQNLRRYAILHRCKPGFTIPGEPVRRMRRTRVLYAPEIKHQSA